MSIVIESHKKIKYDLYTALNTTININGKIHNLTLQVEDKYNTYLTDEICDNVLYLLMPLALRNNLDIVSKIPASKHFLHNLREIYIPSICIGNSKLYNIKIDCEGIDTNYKPFGIGTAFTSGVDSIYTILKYRNDSSFPISHLCVCNSSVDLGYQNEYTILNWHMSNPYYFERANSIGIYLHLPVIKIYSNYLKFLCIDNNIRHLYTHHYITLAHILALKKLLKMYYFSGERPFNNFTLQNVLYDATTKHELLCNLVLTHDKFYCHNTGIDALNRIEKIPPIMDSDLKQFLHPCFKKTEKNCSKTGCKKCLHMLCTLDHFNILDKAEGIYDITKYKLYKEKYLQKLIKNKDNIFLTYMYELMYKKYPDIMKKLEEQNV